MQLITQIQTSVHNRERELLQALKQARETQLEQLTNLGDEKAAHEDRVRQNSDAAGQQVGLMYNELRGQLEQEI